MRLWTLILVLFLATIAGIYIRQDPGYVLFAYRDWTMEMPLWLSAVLFILLLSLALFTLWILNTVFQSGYRVKGWWFKHKQNLARRNTTRGLLELTEGHWLKAERYLRDAARFSDAPVINYLSAAKAAEESGAPDRRDRYLQLAYDLSGSSDVAVRLTEAQLRFKQGDMAQSIHTLQNLQAEQPKHPQVLRLLCTIYEATQDWQALYNLLPSLRKANIFPSKESRELLEQKIYQALLPIRAKEGKASLIHFWDNAPSSVQQSKDSIAIYAQALIDKGADTEAESLLRASLKKNWDKELGQLYGIVQGPSPQKQLNFAESLLQKDKDDKPQSPTHQDPVLLLTLGRLSFRNQLWGKAKDYLEASIAQKPSAEAYALLAELMDRLGFPLKRDECYKKGLLCATTTRI